MLARLRNRSLPEDARAPAGAKCKPGGVSIARGQSPARLPCTSRPAPAGAGSGAHGRGGGGKAQLTAPSPRRGAERRALGRTQAPRNTCRRPVPKPRPTERSDHKRSRRGSPARGLRCHHTVPPRPLTAPGAAARRFRPQPKTEQRPRAANASLPPRGAPR